MDFKIESDALVISDADNLYIYEFPSCTIHKNNKMQKWHI